jgi:hypothetical protein
VFYIFGALGLFWFVAWERFAASSPKELPGVKQEELNFIAANVTENSKVCWIWIFI